MNSPCCCLSLPPSHHQPGALFQFLPKFGSIISPGNGWAIQPVVCVSVLTDLLKNKYPTLKFPKPPYANCLDFPTFEFFLQKIWFNSYVTVLTCKIMQDKIMPVVKKAVQVGTVLISSIQM